MSLQQLWRPFSCLINVAQVVFMVGFGILMWKGYHITAFTLLAVALFLLWLDLHMMRRIHNSLLAEANLARKFDLERIEESNHG